MPTSVPGACTPPPGTASGTTHVLRCETDGKHVALVWGNEGDDLAWRVPDGSRGTALSAQVMGNRGYRYVGPLTHPAEVDALRAEVVRLIDVIVDAAEFLDEAHHYSKADEIRADLPLVDGENDIDF